MTIFIRLRSMFIALALSAVIGGCSDAPVVPRNTTAGTLAVTIAGLPSGTSGVVTISGPDGFRRDLTASTTVTGLPPGAYTITARAASSGGGSVVHTPSPASQSVAVAASAPTAATVTYSVLQLSLQMIATGLASPMFLTAPSSDPRLFIVERAGRIRIMRAGQLLPTPFLDIASRVRTDGERGLLSMAFDPAYATNGYFYLYFTDLNGDITVERHSASPGSDVATNSATPVITVPHRDFSNHNGGLLAFGPDGMLYMATGDGGGGGDPTGNGQNTNTLLGKMLRLDVRTLPYTIPPSNPFVGQSGKRGEIWAVGLRNPWRFDFDTPPGSATSNLYIADVGQGAWEEINVVGVAEAGVNYGWKIMEGAHCFSPATGCNQTGLALPVIEYDHSQGCSITGGFVYRGAALPELAGHYFYSDFCQGWLASMDGSRSTGFATRRWSVAAVGNVVSFGEDGAGEVYVLSQNGTIHKIVRRP